MFSNVSRGNRQGARTCCAWTYFLKSYFPKFSSFVWYHDKVNKKDFFSHQLLTIYSGTLLNWQIYHEGKVKCVTLKATKLNILDFPAECKFPYLTKFPS